MEECETVCILLLTEELREKLAETQELLFTKKFPYFINNLQLQNIKK